MNIEDIDTEQGIRRYMLRGIEGLYDLEAHRDHYSRRGHNLRKWVLAKPRVMLDYQMNPITSMEGPRPEGDIFEFGKETTPDLWVSCSLMRMPRADSRCSICGGGWTLENFGDMRPDYDGGMDHRSCVDAHVRRRRVAALEAAGCEVCVENSTAHGHVKDFDLVVGRAHGWVFHKGSNPSYWRASGRPLSLDQALRLHTRPFTGQRGRYSEGRGLLGDVVRVDGHCGCPEPDGPVGHYHIDSDEALTAFVAFLKECA